MRNRGVFSSLFVAGCIISGCTSTFTSPFWGLKAGECFVKKIDYKKLDFCFHEFKFDKKNISGFWCRSSDTLYYAYSSKDTIIMVLPYNSLPKDSFLTLSVYSGLNSVMTVVDSIYKGNNDTLYYLSQTCFHNSIPDVTNDGTYDRLLASLKRNIAISKKYGIIYCKEHSESGVVPLFFSF